jgi:hypothetical protein
MFICYSFHVLTVQGTSLRHISRRPYPSPLQNTQIRTCEYMASSLQKLHDAWPLISIKQPPLSPCPTILFPSYQRGTTTMYGARRHFIKLALEPATYLDTFNAVPT